MGSGDAISFKNGACQTATSSVICQVNVILHSDEKQKSSHRDHLATFSALHVTA